MWKPTSTPWAVDGTQIYRDDGSQSLVGIAECARVTLGEARANAELIVRAVNSHPALVKACEAMLPHVIGHIYVGCQGGCSMCQIRYDAEAAIAAAMPTEPIDPSVFDDLPPEPMPTATDFAHAALVCAGPDLLASCEAALAEMLHMQQEIRSRGAVYEIQCQAEVEAAIAAAKPAP